MTPKEYVQSVLDKYSTPGLKRNQLDREEKKAHLASRGIKGKRAEEVLDELYGPKKS